MKPQVIHHYTAFTFLVLSFLNPSASQVDVTQLESHTAAILQDGHFPSENVGYVVGDMDSILKTEDQGSSWIKIPVGMESAFTGVWFMDDTKGFIVGDTAVYSTSDGGATWRKAYLHTRGGASRIAFYDDRIGLLTVKNSFSDESEILYTEDGGATWKSSQLDFEMTFGFRPSEIRFVSSTVAYIAASNSLLVSEDMGKTWRVKTTAPSANSVESFSFFSLDKGVIGSSYYGGIWAVDTGTTLREVLVRSEGVLLSKVTSDVRMISEDQLLAILDYGKILTAVHFNGTVDTLWSLSDPPISGGGSLEKFVPIKPGVDILIGSEGRMFKVRYDETLGIRTGKLNFRGDGKGIKFSQENRFLLNREEDGKLRSYLINGTLLPGDSKRLDEKAPQGSR